MSLVFPIPPETKVYWYFQGVLKETNGMEWINQLSCFTLTFDGSAKFYKPAVHSPLTDQQSSANLLLQQMTLMLILQIKQRPILLPQRQ